MPNYEMFSVEVDPVDLLEPVNVKTQNKADLPHFPARSFDEALERPEYNNINPQYYGPMWLKYTSQSMTYPTWATGEYWGGIHLQTFLPYESFPESARVLDRQRLGKQRVEAMQILRTIYGHTHGWKHHPAVKMWDKHSYFLELYLQAMIREWVGRGYANSIDMVVDVDWRYDLVNYIPMNPLRPPWLGDPRVHSTHRAALLAKDPEWYGQFGWTEEPKIEYYWAV